ncbi:MAG: hypothetical protein JRJ87_18160 [Deltaproteobacteria bacterium]|nr:hypothetical protein [Deltaproteobacteria bacterium]
MNKTNRISILMVAIIALLVSSCGSGYDTGIDAGKDGSDWTGPERFSKTFTSDEDFDSGIESGVNHTSQPDQLQMNLGRAVFETPFIWIPNSTDNTVSQIDTRSGIVIGTFPLEKDGASCLNPSRTTVNKNNDVWIACRGSANAAKVSHEDGHVMMIVPLEGIPRGMAIDARDNIWIGCGDAEKDDLDPVYKLNEETGECLMGNQPGCLAAPLMVADWPYGAAVDQRGYLWMLSNHHWSDGTLTKIDTSNDTIVGAYKRTDGGCAIFYGIAIDQLGDVWTGNTSCDDVLKFDGETGDFIDGYLSGGSVTRGVSVDLDGNIWVANSGTDTATKLNGRTGAILHTLNVGSHPIGIGVDAYGHVWAVNRNANNVYKINGITFDIQIIPVGQGPYTYSDMLGTALRTITLSRDASAYWTVSYDTRAQFPDWKTISWNSQEPGDSTIRVRNRCAAEEAGLYTATWSDQMDAGGPMNCLQERWIQVEVEFNAPDLATTPMLEDLTIVWED